MSKNMKSLHVASNGKIAADRTKMEISSMHVASKEPMVESVGKTSEIKTISRFSSNPERSSWLRITAPILSRVTHPALCYRTMRCKRIEQITRIRTPSRICLSVGYSWMLSWLSTFASTIAGSPMSVITAWIAKGKKKTGKMSSIPGRVG